MSLECRRAALKADSFGNHLSMDCTRTLRSTSVVVTTHISPLRCRPAALMPGMCQDVTTIPFKSRERDLLSCSHPASWRMFSIFSLNW